MQKKAGNRAHEHSVEPVFAQWREIPRRSMKILVDMNLY